MCEWWFTSVVSREDMLRRGEEDLHQQGDADRDCYDHVQLWVLSGHSGHIAALQLNSGHSSLTLVTVAQLDFR